MTPLQVTRALAWFGICLGAAELFASRKVARWAGLEDRSNLIKAYGAREIASGLIVLAAERPQAALWTRVAGDGLDAALLASGMKSTNPHRGRTFLATLLVAPVVALDWLYARKGTATIQASTARE